MLGAVPASSAFSATELLVEEIGSWGNVHDRF
jgi:hypothetical protein